MTEFEELNEDILKCDKCKLNKLRGFGFGNIHSKIMFLGQNPGMQAANSTTKSEDIVPFSLNTEKGEASGKYFRKFLDEFGLTNDDFYITNIIKCPREDSNDPPTPEECENCREFFIREFKLQQPDLIVGLGNPSRDYMGLKRNGILKTKNETHFISVWHPGYISRSPNKFEDWVAQLKPALSIIEQIKNGQSQAEEVEVVETEAEPRQESYRPFVHLHIHDEYSLLDGFSKVEDYAEEAAKRGWKYLAITNHGMMGQIPRQFKACQTFGLTPIYGCEVYVNQHHQYRSYMTKEGGKKPLPEGYESLEQLKKLVGQNYHLTLLAKNEVGFKNLLKVSSHGWVHGFYRKPRTNFEFIFEHKEGLICASACMGGPLSRMILDGEIEKAHQSAQILQEEFGDDFYIELMMLEIKGQKEINLELMNIAQKYGIPLIMTNDTHYLEENDSYYQDILLLLQNGNTIKDLEESKQGKRKAVFQFDSKELWFKTAEEMDATHRERHSYIPDDVYAEAMDNTLKVAAKCEVELDTTLKIPSFTTSEEFPEEYRGYEGNEGVNRYLRAEGYKGLAERGLEGKQDYIDRMEMELDVIVKKDFSSYFLIVKDIVDFAKSEDIQVGPGRGCFVGETQVLMKDGSKKAIKDIEFGDSVKNYYEGDSVVEEKFEYDVEEELIEIEFEDGRTIRCTKDHKFLTQRGMVKAEELENDVVDVFNTRTLLKSKRTVPFKGKVYDIGVSSKDHTYNVDGLVVHNSAAGSLLCYCLGITDVDPLVHNLFFERFLNEARKDIPDIDIDFSPSGRDQIKAYMIEKYGKEYTCSIGTYGSFQTKATVADVCRVFGIPLGVSRLVSKSLGGELDELDWEETRNHELYKEYFDKLDDPQYAVEMRGHRISPLEAIGKMRFKQKNVSSHAAGFIISNVNLHENLPLMTKDGTVLSAWIEGKKGTELSTFGFVKWDILGLLNLVFIKEAVDLIEERHGKTIDVHDIDNDLNDPAVYRDLRKGRGSLIFQFESPLMRKLLKESDCDSFNTLAAITALGRPGPLQSNMTDEFCKRKLGKSDYELHPVLEEVLGYTYGIVVYQEQIMQIVNKLAGYSLAETDLFRKVLIKVKKDTKGEQGEKLAAYRRQFVEGGQKYMKKEELEELFEGFQKWAGYGFNKSHAVSYTIISYRCAWLRTHYPVEYICAVLRNVSKGESNIRGKKTNKYETYVYEAKRHKIEVLPPDINKSGVNFTIESDNQIRIGLCNIKGSGVDAAKEIVSHQEYGTFQDFLKKSKATKRVVVPLIICGAFDSLCGRIEALTRYYHHKKTKGEDEYTRLTKDPENAVFMRMAAVIKDLSNNFVDDFGKIDIDTVDFEQYELSEEEKKEWFYHEFSFYLVHPFDDKVKREGIDLADFDTIPDMHDAEGGKGVAEIRSAITRKTKTNDSEYKSVTLECGPGSENTLKVNIFNPGKYGDLLTKGKMVYFGVKKDGDFFNLSFIMSIDQMKSLKRKFKLVRNEIRKKIGDRIVDYVSLEDLDKEENGMLVKIYGYVSEIYETAKKKNCILIDLTGRGSTYVWKNQGDVLDGIKEGDFVRMNVENTNFGGALISDVRKVDVPEAKVRKKRMGKKGR